MGKLLVIGIGAHCAAAPMFIPGSDPGKNHTIVTVIVNRGKTKGGVDMKSAVTLNIWGKYAGVAACHLDKGRQIDFEGELLDHTKDTGVAGADGKKIIFRRNEVRVNRFYFGGDTLKELTSRIGKNLASLQAMNVPVTPDALLKTIRNTTVDYNPVLAAQTGMYGNARVWSKGAFVQAGGVPVVQNAAAAVPVQEKTVEQLQIEMDALKVAIAGAQVGAGASPVDVFAGAAA